MTDEEIRAAIEVPAIVSLWGCETTFTPAFVEEKLGDGLQWIWLAPMNARPKYYVIRIDSAWKTDNDQWNGEDTIGDHIDEIYEAIEDEYGCSEDEMNAGTAEFPHITIEGGSCWGKYNPSFEAQHRDCKGGGAR
jgi:hypothetical protein